MKTKTETTQETKTKLESVDIALIKLLARFDMIESYTRAIVKKLEDLNRDLNKTCSDNPLMLMHTNTIGNLLANIQNEISEALDTDLKCECSS